MPTTPAVCVSLTDQSSPEDIAAYKAFAAAHPYSKCYERLIVQDRFGVVEVLDIQRTQTTRNAICGFVVFDGTHTNPNIAEGFRRVSPRDVLHRETRAMP